MGRCVWNRGRSLNIHLIRVKKVWLCVWSSQTCCFVIPKLINAWMPNLKHFAVTVLSLLLFAVVVLLNNKSLDGKQKEEKMQFLWWNRHVLSKCLKPPRKNKVTQYLEACFCYCHPGHLSGPFSKLSCDVALWVPSLWDFVTGRQSFINPVIN